MLIYQGAKAMEIWTGKYPDVKEEYRFEKIAVSNNAKIKKKSVVAIKERIIYISYSCLPSYRGFSEPKSVTMTFSRRAKSIIGIISISSDES